MPSKSILYDAIGATLRWGKLEAVATKNNEVAFSSPMQQKLFSWIFRGRTRKTFAIYRDQ